MIDDAAPPGDDLDDLLWRVNDAAESALARRLDPARFIERAKSRSSTSPMPSTVHAEPGPVGVPLAVKILIAGAFGVGKSTLVGAVSEIRPMHTDEMLTNASIGTDDVSAVETKKTTTVAMDFGRISINDDLVLYLFGTPGQDRFWFVWDELALGALGAVVLADTRRLAECFPPVDYFERRGMPFVLAVNCFDGQQQYSVDSIREAVDLDPHVPVVLCDARDRRSVKDVLIALIEHVMSMNTTIESVGLQTHA